jgi:hypothetical protein
MDQHFQAALKLHQYLVCRHWREQGLIGPDSGIRFNYRVGRFVKSYLRFIPWYDEYYYLQAQSYWVLSNWRLFTLTHEETYRQIAVRCSALMLTQQRTDGAWVYPNREWKGRIATAEGTWGALSLLETYRNTGDPTFLLGVLRWHQFLVKNIGWQQIGEELAINYFANRSGSRIANNSAFVLRFLVELADLTGDKTYLQPCDGLLTFLQRVQEPTGEFPYAVNGTIDDESRLHFQCYQYNAFQCLDLMKYYEITGEAVPLALITKVLGFLRQGLAGDGHALYECGASAWHREVTYHTAALAAAFVKAEQLSVGGYGDLAVRAYAHLLDLQRPDGSFPHSQRDYFILKDQRPYPRNLSMILYHLLSTQED